MKRRDFCQSIGVLGLAVSIPPVPAAAAPRTAGGASAQQAFASSFEAVPEQFGPTRLRFDRPLPEGLRGTLYRNGPAGMAHGTMRYRHWFDGDGMVHAWQLAGDSVVHRARIVQTDRRRAERAAGRLLWPGFGTDVADSRTVVNADTMNVANISVLPVAEELLALWEAGSSWALDPDTLETRERKVFSGDTDGLPFSAHPRIDTNGTIWNFGYLSGSGQLLLYELDRRGRLRRAAAIEAPQAEMVHDFVITERHLGFVLMPLAYDRQAAPGTAFMNRLHWRDQAPVIVLLIDKQRWQISHRFEVPAFFAFHFGNAHADGETVRISVARAPAFAPLMTAIGQATRGEPVTIPNREALSELVLDLRSGSASLQALPVLGAEFPCIDPRQAGRRNRHTYMLGNTEQQARQMFGFNSVMHFDHERGHLARFDYGAHTLAEEHLFVAAPGGREGEGWLLGTAFDWRAHRTRLSVFDASHLADGPVATAELPYGLPLGLHGRWRAAS
ncbi:MAG: carotenoid oxygenase family protein [Burkholderiaceae bacterium]